MPQIFKDRTVYCIVLSFFLMSYSRAAENGCPVFGFLMFMGRSAQQRNLPGRGW